MGGSLDLDVIAILDRGLGAQGAWNLSGDSGGFVEVWPRETRALASQGWKLHVSAVPRSAQAVLERALPVLAGERVTFKVARSLDVLISLNEGASGLSQVGKFITVYPDDDEQAVRLARELDRTTAGLQGPSVPSDRPVRMGSLVHYRYGGFGGGLIQLPHGELATAVVDPDGRVVPDVREAAYAPPDWARDPFLAAGVAEELPQPGQTVAGRFLAVALLHRSPRGTVELGIDVERGRRCVLKRARRGAAASVSGTDAVDQLRNEARILERLRDDGIAPEPLGLVEHDGDLCLAMEDVPGPTLAARVAALRARAVRVGAADVVGAGRELARALGRLHARDIVHRDVKASNFIVTPEGPLRMVDLELAHERGSGVSPYGLGTHGYMSPQQLAGAPPEVADDVYGLGATLFSLATGADASQAPEGKPLTARPLELLAPALDVAVRRLIERCLDPEPALRPATMAELDAELAACQPGSGTEPPSYGETRATRSEPEARERARERALALGLTLARSAVPAPGGVGRGWDSRHEASRGFAARDLNAGTAGCVLALAELVDEFGDRELRAALLDAVAWLVSAPAPGGDPVLGLYVGEAGIAVALLRAGQVLALSELVESGAARLRAIAALPHRSADLFNGSAGRLRAHLIAYDHDGDDRHLDAAALCGEAIVSAAVERDGGGLAWEMPPDHGGLSGQVYAGYAHGAAGIGDALLDLVAVTGDARPRDAASGAARWLSRLAEPALDDGSGREWPTEEGSDPLGPVWCHGSSGVGQFFARAAELGIDPRAGELADAAARTVALGGRSLGPAQCHGLSGSIEFLLDRFRATGDERHLAEARTLERVLDGFAVDGPAGLAWYSDRAGLIAPGYMVGYAGVAMCLLRLADPERRPRQLGREGFAFRAGRDVRSS